MLRPHSHSGCAYSRYQWTGLAASRYSDGAILGSRTFHDREHSCLRRESGSRKRLSSATVSLDGRLWTASVTFSTLHRIAKYMGWYTYHALTAKSDCLRVPRSCTEPSESAPVAN